MENNSTDYYASHTFDVSFLSELRSQVHFAQDHNQSFVRGLLRCSKDLEKTLAVTIKNAFGEIKTRDLNCDEPLALLKEWIEGDLPILRLYLALMRPAHDDPIRSEDPQAPLGRKINPEPQHPLVKGIPQYIKKATRMFDPNNEYLLTQQLHNAIPNIALLDPLTNTELDQASAQYDRDSQIFCNAFVTSPRWNNIVVWSGGQQIQNRGWFKQWFCNVQKIGTSLKEATEQLNREHGISIFPPMEAMRSYWEYASVERRKMRNLYEVIYYDRINKRPILAYISGPDYTLADQIAGFAHVLDNAEANEAEINEHDQAHNLEERVQAFERGDLSTGEVGDLHDDLLYYARFSMFFTAQRDDTLSMVESDEHREIAARKLEKLLSEHKTNNSIKYMAGGLLEMLATGGCYLSMGKVPPMLSTACFTLVSIPANLYFMYNGYHRTMADYHAIFSSPEGKNTLTSLRILEESASDAVFDTVFFPLALYGAGKSFLKGVYQPLLDTLTQHGDNLPIRSFTEALAY